MFRSTFLSTTCTIILLLATTNVWAHHSASGYNIDKRIELQGTVIKAKFRNPHGMITVRVTRVSDMDSGKDLAIAGVDEWEVETAAANLLRRRGWDFKAVKKGMSLTFVGHPTKEPSPIMYLREIHMPDGTVMGDPDGKDKALD